MMDSDVLLMNAVAVTAAGPPEVLKCVLRTPPQPQAGELLIEVKAAGVNGHDLSHRRIGSHPILPGESDLPGLEVSGIVREVGTGCSRFKPGDHVCALLRGGGYAELCVAHEACCLPIPAGLDWVQAAALPEVLFTVWSNLFVDNGFAPGEKVLIHGGASGIGVAALQLVTLMGGTAIVTVGTRQKAQACLALGAHEAIVHTEEDFESAVRQATKEQGVDMVLDMVGGDYVSRGLRCLASDGRYLLLAAPAGKLVHMDLGLVMQRRLRVTGSTLRPRPLAYKAEIARQLEEKVWPLIARGDLRVVIDSVHEFAAAADAHQRMEQRLHAGKLVLVPGAPRN